MGAVVHLRLAPRTYEARRFDVLGDFGRFQLSGTLDGFIDLAVHDDRGGRTYPLSLEEASALAAALNGAIKDVATNCLYDRDALLIK